MRTEILEKFKRNLLKIFPFRNQTNKFGILKLLDYKRKQIYNLIQNIKPLNSSEKNLVKIYDLVIEFISQYYNEGILNCTTPSNKHLANSINSNDLIVDWLNKDQYYIKPKEFQNNTNRNFLGEYFIHKDLKGFFTSELEKFIKDKILVLDSLFKLKAEDLQKKLKLIKIVERISLKIIDKLAQFENFQKKLWLKKSLVLTTNYIITLKKIEEYGGEDLLDYAFNQIIQNKEQLKEWQKLFNILINDKSDFENLKKKNKWLHLPIDTKNFNDEFTWNLLSSMSKKHNLDDIIDGTIIKSDNAQALSLIMKKWCEKINLIYIDPPFNTGKKKFLYKNDYSNSSWLVMMYHRLNLAREILHNKGTIFVRIDNNGNHFVRILLDLIFNNSNFRNEIIINKTKAKRRRKKPFIQQTESLFFYSKKSDYLFNQLEIPREKKQWFELLDFPRPNKTPRTVLGKTYYPPKNRRWGLSQDRINDFEQKGKVRINKNKSYTNCHGKVINEKPELFYDTEPVRNDWLDIPGYSQVHKFSTENSEELLQRVVECGSQKNDVILDFFLGSGTTIATAQKLNRKWIGIEIGPQFEEYILPRMKTVLKGDKTGISKLNDTNKSGFLKYQILEQFEDTIENVEFKDKLDEEFFNFNLIEDPFNFKMNILGNGKLIKVDVDLVESFNYLIGLFIEKVETRKEKGRTYIFIKGKVNKKKIIVIWRSFTGLDLEQDKKTIYKHLNDDNYIHIYVNGKCLIENAKSIEKEMKKLMWE